MYIDNFYPFGRRNGDNVVSRDINGMGEIKLSMPFSFFMIRHRNLLVSIIFCSPVKWNYSAHACTTAVKRLVMVAI